MTKLWKFLIDPKNRRVLGWIGGAIVAFTSGGWAVATYIWPRAEPPTIVCAQNGSIAAGKDATGNRIQYTTPESTKEEPGSQTCGEPEHR